ncbi:MAG: hypothetical protein JXA19_04965 [Anaerolineales bacterium]|nr:hypothetical protein [Anaerolineales bacterium]
MKYKQIYPLIFMVLVLFLAGIACEKAGEILPPAEATVKAQAFRTQTAAAEVLQIATNAKFKANDTIIFFSDGVNVPLYSEAGVKTPFMYAAVGNNGIIKESTELEDGVIWYKVLSTSGNGWVPEEFLAAPGENVENAGIAVGDNVYLGGVGFMVSLYDQPGSTNIRAQATRGDEVEILDITEYNGTNWYKVATLAGDGWLEEGYITTVK